MRTPARILQIEFLYWYRSSDERIVRLADGTCEPMPTGIGIHDVERLEIGDERSWNERILREWREVVDACADCAPRCYEHWRDGSTSVAWEPCSARLLDHPTMDVAAEYEYDTFIDRGREDVA